MAVAKVIHVIRAVVRRSDLTPIFGQKSGDAIRLRAEMPVWCDGCDAWKKPSEPHVDGCSVEMDEIAKEYRGRARGQPSFRIYALLYGIFIVIALACFIFWRAFL